MREIARHTEQSKGSLLVVDDDIVQRSVIGKVGAKLGFDTTIASSFEKAAILLKKQKFDVMTLDLSLGERDGVEILHLLTDRNLHSMRIVIISGCDERILNSTKRVAASLRLCVVGCLSKPLQLDELRSALSSPKPAMELERRQASHYPQIDGTVLQHAILSQELFVEFQPKVDLASGSVVGAEALVRWRSPEAGLIAPAAFIPEMEAAGLMPELTYYVLQQALTHGRRLIEKHQGFTIAVNVPGSMMIDRELPERIETLLVREQISPSSLIVELTESVAMSEVGTAADILVRLRLKGIGAAIDDFGTGYSSLAALARLPFSELKIDKSFVGSSPSDPDMLKIVEASVGLARAFKMKVVAEGIDSNESLAVAKKLGCELGQGFLFAPALGIDEAIVWIDLQSKRVGAGAELLAS